MKQEHKISKSVWALFISGFLILALVFTAQITNLGNISAVLAEVITETTTSTQNNSASCGTANGQKYLAYRNAFEEYGKKDTLCSQGNPDGSVSFPRLGTSATWKCVSESRQNRISCTATHLGLDFNDNNMRLVDSNTQSVNYPADSRLFSTRAKTNPDKIAGKDFNELLSYYKMRISYGTTSITLDIDGRSDTTGIALSASARAALGNPKDPAYVSVQLVPKIN